MTVTDIVVIGIFIFHGLRGWTRGLWRSLLRPAALVISLATAVLYFQKTHNIFISFNISLFLPFLLTFLGSMMLKVAHTESGGKEQTSLASRALGAGFSMFWGGGMTALMILLVGLMPFEFLALGKMKADVLRSKSFAILSSALEPHIPALRRSAEKKIAMESLPQYQALIQDPRVKDMMTDPEVLELIRTKNYLQLMNNEKFKKVLQDPALMKKFLELQKNMPGVNVPAEAPATSTGAR